MLSVLFCSPLQGIPHTYIDRHLLPGHFLRLQLISPYFLQKQPEEGKVHHLQKLLLILL